MSGDLFMSILFSLTSAVGLYGQLFALAGPIVTLPAGGDPILFPHSIFADPTSPQSSFKCVSMRCTEERS